MSISLTIDNFNSEILGRLQSEAQRRGVEVKVLVEEIIQDKLGAPVKSDSTQSHHELDALAGTWSAEEAENFLSTIAEMRQCDEGLWK
jgi:hypothetical protein